jgi:glycosyltransferase involved in cell wall biosynthesis
MAIENLLKNPARRSELGQTARAEVCNNYQWAQFARRLDEIYSEAVRS